MNEMMSPADMKAIMGNDENNCGGMNGWFWIIILFLFRGNGLFGNGEQNNVQEQIRAGFDQNTVVNKLDNLGNGVSDLGFTLSNSIRDTGYATLQGQNGIERAIADCCCNTQKGIIENRYADERNTCQIIQALHDDGERTRAILVQSQIDTLRDRVADKDRDILARDMQLSQLSQTANIESTILNSIGRYVTNPPCNYSYNPCGCGSFCS